MLRSLVVAATTAVAPGIVFADAPSIIQPPAIAPGARIAIVAPAKSISSDAVTSLTLGLQNQGFVPVPDPSLTSEFGYLAGNDKTRADAFNRALRDPEIDAIFCATGGYGTTRILHLIDYAAFRQNPKIVTGFSDITGLHLALWKETGVVTFHSPTNWRVIANDLVERPYAAANFWQVLRQTTPAFTYPLPASTQTIVPGTARGRLVGGNLSLVHALMGTPYEIETDGQILFLEEIREYPYRVDRMLSTLQLAGKLEKPAAVIIGQFTKCTPDEGSTAPGFTVEELFLQYFAHRSYPVVSNFPVGHVEDSATLPIGVLAELNAMTGQLQLLEAPVRAASTEKLQ
jgi:muramoyltetrapeptide carboxypeptidase